MTVAFGAEPEFAETSALSDEALLSALDEIRHITSYPTNDQIIDQFNAYVRGPLRDKVLQSMGQEDYISFKLCLVATLPWVFNSMVYLLGCDGYRDCESRALDSGFSSASQYLVSNLMTYGFTAALGTILEVPPMLITCRYLTEILEPGATRMLLGCFLCSVLLFTGDTLLLLQRAMTVVMIAKRSALWIGFFVTTVLLQLCLAWWFFVRKKLPPSQRKMLRWSELGLFQENWQPSRAGLA